MDRRNWLELSRKLVDRYDLNQTMDWVDDARGHLANDILGEGVLQTRDYTNPLVVTLSGATLGGNYTAGPAYDEAGKRIIAISGGSFAIPAADTVNPRKDLIVIRYTPVNDTPIPKPSDPITTTYLNLLDGFTVVVRPGTAAPSPAYPAPQAGDVILGGVLVPANATLGTSCTLDSAIRQIAGVIGLAFKAEVPAGSISPAQLVFTTTLDPFGEDYVWLFIDGIQADKSRWTLQNGNEIHFASGEEPTDVGQSITVIYAYSNVGLTLGGGGGGGGGGSTARTTNTVSANFTVPTLTGDYVLNVDTSGGAITVTLPDATLCDGFVVDVKNIGSPASPVTVNPFGSQTIDDASADSVDSQFDSKHYCAVGGNWFIY